ncbi:hypothetical protein [Paenimyroides aestuarii]|uniref:DUF2116 family Zn-ribbon domain-containing protein n=1 Tax=Paenimyroides aestuarii TaxID=2968490 RepID=A0ABY5NUI9_9FLAO|nr:hypothetical protein [Paenimyroides aestuarii]UUV22112.1 hypothetical protein NPX36_03445 [Paenimyroides aestuarii]
MGKNCLECGEKIIGREDKKFCNDSCRNTYNNKLNKDTTNFMRTVNYTLRKNYRILCENNPDGKTKINRKKLLDLGFDFSLFTSIYTTKSNVTYYFVYDQGYMLIEHDWLVLVKKN